MRFHSHHNIWRDAQVPQRTFHYYHPESRGLDFAALMDDIKVSKTNLISQLLYLVICTSLLIRRGNNSCSCVGFGSCQCMNI
jgi:hypothetical protein